MDIVLCFLQIAQSTQVRLIGSDGDLQLMVKGVKDSLSLDAFTIHFNVSHRFHLKWIIDNGAFIMGDRLMFD